MGRCFLFKLVYLFKKRKEHGICFEKKEPVSCEISLLRLREGQKHVEDGERMCNTDLREKQTKRLRRTT